MGRRRKGLPNIYDIREAIIPYPCSNESCSYKHEKTGRWFDRHGHFSCPSCGHYTAIDYERLLGMHSDRVKALCDVLERLWGKALGEK